MQISFDNTELILPDWLTQVESLPEDPENSVPFAARFEHCMVLCMITEEAHANAMDFESPDVVTADIRSLLSETQGIIEVVSGQTAMGNRCIYSIVKNRMKPTGVEYILSMDIEKAAGSNHVQAYFAETGTTGTRDVMVYDLVRRKGSDPMEDGTWCYDPYDSTYTEGFLMNQSEERQFDEMFPEHPLSLARELVRQIGAAN